MKLRSPSELSQHALGVEVSGEDELGWSRITSYELCGSGPLIAQQVGRQKKRGCVILSVSYLPIGSSYLSAIAATGAVLHVFFLLP